ncbi:hypothetical protein CCUS01_00427 [Colletotrichum cuscutae]|uniref:Uncharacterized protein n=1 Tax=Colletotrichum cuscutae TaxID=1209917 RepID=A0AAI9VAD1_9PEZI|nr:hypothetical protein CCUS01_00427 [Colletotrichum cuscutae]
MKIGSRVELFTLFHWTTGQSLAASSFPLAVAVFGRCRTWVMSGPAAAKRLRNGCTSAHIQRYLSSPTQTGRMRSGITVPAELPG